MSWWELFSSPQMAQEHWTARCTILHLGLVHQDQQSSSNEERPLAGSRTVTLFSSSVTSSSCPSSSFLWVSDSVMPRWVSSSCCAARSPVTSPCAALLQLLTEGHWVGEDLSELLNHLCKSMKTVDKPWAKLSKPIRGDCHNLSPMLWRFPVNSVNRISWKSL